MRNVALRKSFFHNGKMHSLKEVLEFYVIRAPGPEDALAPLQRPDGENPYAVHADVQETMSNLVGIIRTETEIRKALAELDTLGVRAEDVGAAGGSAYNPGWHLALDLRNIMLMAKCVASAALERQDCGLQTVVLP